MNKDNLTNRRLVAPGYDVGGDDIPMNDMITGSGECDETGHKGAYAKGYHDLGPIDTSSDPVATVPGTRNRHSRI